MGAIPVTLPTPEVEAHVAGIGADWSVIARRLACWVRAQGQTKAVARDLGACPKTVSGWRDGSGAGSATLERLANHYGAPFLEYLFQPWLERVETSIDAKLARAAADVARARALIAETQNAAHGRNTDGGFLGVPGGVGGATVAPAGIPGGVGRAKVRRAAPSQPMAVAEGAQ